MHTSAIFQSQNAKNICSSTLLPMNVTNFNIPAIIKHVPNLMDRNTRQDCKKQRRLMEAVYTRHHLSVSIVNGTRADDTCVRVKTSSSAREQVVTVVQRIAIVAIASGGCLQ
ncbi:conserved hypothetical protein [Ricinus communis]|uniref:Uncharacterized protein n=1 Tax=Ricinus communis TaxID=3988 RepID=B9SQ37_RICCO|nr:conserved hypothetical protein [Ricinus communis]